MSQFSDNFGQSAPPGSYGQQPPARTSGKAVASLVFGLLSFCMSFLAGIPAIMLGVLALRDVGRGQGRVSGQGLAIAGLITGSLGTLLSCLMLPALLLPAVQAAREAARRMESMNNLRQISFALQSHEDRYQRLPDVGTENAAPPDAPRRMGAGLSWRVRLLPFLDEDSLYQQFHLDEPWDSPHNKQLIPLMPKVYQSPNFTSPEFKTVYLAVVGSEDAEPSQRTALRRADRVSLSDISRWDGMSQTVLVVEADVDQAVIWTKPDDWKLDLQDPRRGLGHLRPNGFLAVFADGSVRFLPNVVSDEELRSLFLCNDKNVVDLSKYDSVNP